MNRPKFGTLVKLEAQSTTHALLDSRRRLSDEESLDELLYNPFDEDVRVDSSCKLVK